MNERAILGLKMVRPHNFGSTLKIFLKFCTMEGAKRYTEIILMVFLKKKKKKSQLGQMGHFRSKNGACSYFRSALDFLKFCTMKGVMQSEQSKQESVWVYIYILYILYI